MRKVDSLDLKLLESGANLRKVAADALKYNLSSEHANQICACLQQGRVFWEAAENSPWEIKPLLAHYGLAALLIAVTMARSRKKLETFVESHGVSDISQPNSKLEELTVKVDNRRGTFQEINDAFGCLEKIIVHTNKEEIKVLHPTSPSSELVGRTITLKDIIARIPGLEEIYEATFNEEPCLAKCSHFSQKEEGGKKWIEFEVFLRRDSQIVSLESVSRHADNLRKKFTFLRKWRVTYASFSSLRFANIEPIAGNEFAEDLWKESTYIHLSYESNAPVGEGGNGKPEDLIQFCDPVAGGFIDNTYLIQPLSGTYVSQTSLYFLGMFLLSSLVRYRPNIWANAISRRAIGDSPVDDRALAVIEFFVEHTLDVMPRVVLPQCESHLKRRYASGGKVACPAFSCLFPNSTRV